MAEETVTSSTTVTNVEPVAERLLTQSEVNKLVGGVRKEQYDKGYNEAYQKAKAEMQPTAAPVIDEAIIEKKVEALVAKKQQEQVEAANKAAYAQLNAEIAEKVTEASARIPDYNQVIAEAGLADGSSKMNLAIMHFGNQVENSGDLFYELGKSPSKLANLTSLIASGNVAGSTKYVKELSAAIKGNKSSDFKVPASPLSTITPSAIGADNKNESDFVKAMRTAQVKHKV